MRFSIITCTKNSERFLADTINSVKSQTFHDYEHIFIDGFSTDGTKEMILEYQKQDPDKVKFFQFNAKGITNAMNQGIMCAKGKYIIHLHGDDYFNNENVLEKVNGFLHAHQDLDWIYAQIQYIDSENKQIGLRNLTRFSRLNSESSITKQILKYRNVICHQSVFICKEIFNKFGLFDENDKYTADYDYWLKIMDKTKWQYYNEIISNFRIHEGSTTSSTRNRYSILLSLNLCQKRHLNYIEYHIILPLHEMISSNYSLIRETIKVFRDTKHIGYLA